MYGATVQGLTVKEEQGKIILKDGKERGEQIYLLYIHCLLWHLHIDAHIYVMCSYIYV